MEQKFASLLHSGGEKTVHKGWRESNPQNRKGGRHRFIIASTLSNAGEATYPARPIRKKNHHASIIARWLSPSILNY